MDSVKYKPVAVAKLGLQMNPDSMEMGRARTEIDWRGASNHFKFFFDYEGIETEVSQWLRKSKLTTAPHLNILYGWGEPAIKIPTKFFFEDWEGFFQSVQYNTIIWDDSLELVMEITKDYYLHSNFRIKPEK